MNSTMFLRNITCIDHAYVDKDGFIVGGSKHQLIHVTGAVDEHEQVVVDFSNIKKFLKGAIDDNETGYDHKLWIFTEESGCVYVENNADSTYTITSKHFFATLPQNAVRIINGSRYTLNNEMSLYLLNKAQKQYGAGIVNITVELSDLAFTVHPWKKMFTYTHGLRNSTSWGCQNPCHGHLSFLELVPVMGADIDQVTDLCDRIGEWLDSKVLVFDKNITNRTDTGFTVSYCTEQRGRFAITYNNTHPHEMFNQETTIENIVEFIMKKFGNELQYLGVRELYVSEGLAKGAVVTIS
jgi:6-pyruvoyl-tetrahydropterin synthase